MALHRLLFDAANAAESANVGANVRAGDDGTLIGHVSDALKVNFTNATLAVTATNLDIRDLVFATDKVDVSGSAVSITGTVAVTQSTSPWVVGDGGGSLTVDAVNLDIRDLVAATDSVSSYTKDGAGTSITSTLVSGKQGLDVNVINSIDVDDGLANTAIDASSETVTTTSAALIASPLSARKYVLIYNHGNKAVFVGESGITTGQGFPVYPGVILETRIGAAVAIHAVAQSGSQDIRILQAS